MGNKKIPLILIIFLLLSDVFVCAQGTQIESSPIYYLNGKVGIQSSNPEAKLEVVGSGLPAGTPIMIINHTWGSYSPDPDQNRPFTIRRNSSNNESVSLFIQDANSHFVYTNDEHYGYIDFRIINKDIESGGGSRANDNVVLRLRGDQNGGFVSIGATSFDSNYRLAVNGAIRAKEIKVETGWSDFVFEDDYRLRPLAEVEQFIKENKHLPDIPSAKEVETNGVNVGEMEAKLLQKIEELTLYVIELKKENEKQDNIIMSQQEQINKLKDSQSAPGPKGRTAEGRVFKAR